METQLTFDFDLLDPFTATQTPTSRGRAGRESKGTNRAKAPQPTSTTYLRNVTFDAGQMRRAADWWRSTCGDAIPF